LWDLVYTTLNDEQEYDEHRCLKIEWSEEYLQDWLQSTIISTKLFVRHMLVANCEERFDLILYICRNVSTGESRL